MGKGGLLQKGCHQKAKASATIQAAKDGGEVFLWVFSGSRDISGLLSFIAALEFSPLKRGAEVLWPKAAGAWQTLLPWVCGTGASPAAPMAKAQGGGKARISANSLLQGNGRCMC